MTSTLSKQPKEHDGNGKNNKLYLGINDNLYSLLNVIIRLYGSPEEQSGERRVGKSEQADWIGLE